MRHASAHLFAMAERLVAYEANGKESPARTTSPGVAVCEKLRTQLSTLMGNAGFNALFVRAIALAKKELPDLSELEIQPSGTIIELHAAEFKANLPELSRTSVLVLAELLGLLVAFIGESLVVGIVQEIWPKFSLKGFDNIQEKK